jgi:hypothetical protein
VGATFSGGFFGVQDQLEARDLVPQAQPALFQAAHHELVNRAFMAGSVDQRIEVGMFHPQLDQPAFGGMEVGIQQFYKPCGCLRSGSFDNTSFAGNNRAVPPAGNGIDCPQHGYQGLPTYRIHRHPQG